MTAQAKVIGIEPWFPGFLGRWKWLNEMVPAERVAAFRIATACVLLIDILFGYLPHFSTIFNADALGGRDLYAHRFRDGHFYWSVLRWLPDNWGPSLIFGVWIASAVALLVGWRPLISGLLAWICAVSVFNIHLGLNNGGDRLRNTILLTLALSASGSVWGISSARRRGVTGPILVPGWPLNVLFVQLAALYFFGGVYKVMSPAWRSGYVMYFISHDLAWSLTPAQSSKLPIIVHQMSAWATILWELGFPILALMKGTRAATFLIGVIFHLGTFFTLEVGTFALYPIACYCAFLPWERIPFARHGLFRGSPCR